MNSRISKVTPSNNIILSYVSITRLTKYKLLVEIDKNTYIWK